MNDLPRHTLSRIIAEHGREICDTPKRVEALLRDLCGANRREINIITGALEERIPSDLMAAGNSVPRDLLLSRLAARLRDDLAYTPEAARWGVEAWAVALGILSEAELREREREESTEASRNAGATPPAQKPKPPTDPPQRIDQPAPQPQRGTAHALPPKPPQATKPTLTPQATRTGSPSQGTKTGQASPVVRASAPVQSRKPTTNINAATTGQPQQNVLRPHPPQQTRRRGLTLRGCLIGIVLIVLLVVGAIFVVPAVVLLLQEEQSKPSVNEPRIR